MRWLLVGVMLVALAGCSDAGAPSTRDVVTQTPTSSPVNRTTLLVDNCHSAHLRPAVITYACADAGVSFTKLHWSTWTRRMAVGIAGLVGVKKGCCNSHTVQHVRVVAYSPRPYRHGKQAFACMRVSPGLTAGTTSEVLSLSAGTWLGHLDEPKVAFQPCRPRNSA